MEQVLLRISNYSHVCFKLGSLGNSTQKRHGPQVALSEMWTVKCENVSASDWDTGSYWFCHLLTDEHFYSTCKASSTFKYRKQGHETLQKLPFSSWRVFSTQEKEQHLPMITLCDNTTRGDFMKTGFSKCIMSFSHIYLPPCLQAFGESRFYKHNIYTQIKPIWRSSVIW